MRKMGFGRILAIILVLTLTATALYGCSSSTSPSGAKGEDDVYPAASLPTTTAPAAPEETAAGVQSAQPDTGRMIIHSGYITARYEDVAASIEQVTQLVTSMGGYVVTSSLYGSDGKFNGDMSVRVPAESFDAAMQALQDMAVSVKHSSTSGEDVSEEYYDIEARLRVLRATEEQLILLLAEVRKQTNSAEDILAVYRELQNVQSDIERLSGRQQYLSRMVAMSTINLNMLQVPAEAPVIEGTWAPLSTLRSALRSLASTAQVLADAIIWGVFYLLPLVVLLVAPLVAIALVIRWLMRRRRAAVVAAPPASDAEPESSDLGGPTG